MPAVHFYCVLCGAALQAPDDSGPDLTQCDSCSRHVPVPRLASGLGDFNHHAPVFPPDVLELLVKFQCTSCAAMLHAEARYEGRQVACPDCGARTGIPRWSNVPGWPRHADAGEKARMRTTPSPAGAKSPTLSEEEIDFLRGADPRKPEAAA